MTNEQEPAEVAAEVTAEQEPAEQEPVGVTLFEYVGGQPFFDRLVAAFYEGIEHDSVLRPMYPDDDMEGAQRRLSLFLGQYWGGPFTYSEERGHPMLRARHMPFHIDPTARDHWLVHMASAVERCTEPGEVRDMLMGYFVPVADAMRNHP